MGEGAENGTGEHGRWMTVAKEKVNIAIYILSLEMEEQFPPEITRKVYSVTVLQFSSQPSQPRLGPTGENLLSPAADCSMFMCFHSCEIV